MGKKRFSLLLALVLLCTCMPAMAATYSKTTRDLIRIISTTTDNGTPLALFIPEPGAKGVFEDEFDGIETYMTKNSSMLDYFSKDVKTAIAALQPQGADLSKLTLTEYTPFQRTNYDPVMGTVVATIAFASPFTADQTLAVLVGYVGKDGKMVWIPLEAAVTDGSLALSFPPEVLKELPTDIVIAVLS